MFNEHPLDVNLADSDLTGHILIVDDREEGAKIMALLLEEEGHTVQIALRGEEALKRIYERPPDVVILDVMMPDINGMEVLRRLRANPDFAELPIIMVTALGDTTDVVRGIELGATDYLTKPPRFEVLSARVRTQIKLKQLQDQRRHDITRLRQLDMLKDRFMQIAVHDLKNPLNNIVVGLDLLMRYNVIVDNSEREEFQQVIEMMNTSTFTMRTLIDDFLDLSAIQAGQLELNRAATDINRIIEQTVGQFAAYAREKELEVTTELDTTLTSVYIDRNRIGQVLSNLIGNAIKFSPPTGRVHIRCDYVEKGNWVRVQITDTGPGIPPEEQESLFEQYTKASNKPTGKERSSGLGLSIAKELVEQHGGTIGVDSTLGEGSTFWFNLPASPPAG